MRETTTNHVIFAAFRDCLSPSRLRCSTAERPSSGGLPGWRRDGQEKFRPCSQAGGWHEEATHNLSTQGATYGSDPTGWAGVVSLAPSLLARIERMLRGMSANLTATSPRFLSRLRWKVRAWADWWKRGWNGIETRCHWRCRRWIGNGAARTRERKRCCNGQSTRGCAARSDHLRDPRMRTTLWTLRGTHEWMGLWGAAGRRNDG